VSNIRGQRPTAACPEMTATRASRPGVRGSPRPGRRQRDKLTAWITGVRACDLPHLHAFTNGLELDCAAVDAGLSLPHHNRRTEGVNTRTKRIMRQMYGRAGFPLLRHRILLQ
jgi:transposase